jgi:hypothetical protein
MTASSIAAPVLEARDHRRDRQRQIAGRDAVAQIDGQRLARGAVHEDRDLGGRERLGAAASSAPTTPHSTSPLPAVASARTRSD